jgi:hypothetical protein
MLTDPHAPVLKFRVRQTHRDTQSGGGAFDVTVTTGVNPNDDAADDNLFFDGNNDQAGEDAGAETEFFAGAGTSAADLTTTLVSVTRGGQVVVQVTGRVGAFVRVDAEMVRPVILASQRQDG